MANAQLGEGFLVSTLQTFHDKNPEEYKKDMPALLAILQRLKIFTDGTSTKWDNPFVDTLVQAVSASIASNGVITPLDDNGLSDDGGVIPTQKPPIP